MIEVRRGGYHALETAELTCDECGRLHWYEPDPDGGKGTRHRAGTVEGIGLGLPDRLWPQAEALVEAYEQDSREWAGEAAEREWIYRESIIR